MPKQLVRICPSDRFCRAQNLPTSSVELIWPITELYFRQILATDFMNRFYVVVVVVLEGLRKGGIHCISQVFPWHFYFMREDSLVELTEHDDSAANIIVHSMYTYMYSWIHSTY